MRLSRPIDPRQFRSSGFFQLWKVNSATGARKSSTPDAVVVLDETGNFGPWGVNGQQSYEINVIRQSAALDVILHVKILVLILEDVIKRSVGCAACPIDCHLRATGHAVKIFHSIAQRVEICR